MKIQLNVSYTDIINVDNLLDAWREFAVGKLKKRDVQTYSCNLLDNIIQLHNNLTSKSYVHSGYESFRISDPKPRHIHKASVRDRLLHHALYRVLYPFFDKTFIADSYSCRLGKGTHKAMDRFRGMAYKVSQNHTRTCWVLKCDIKKFFTSIDHQVLKGILASYIPDADILWLLNQVIDSFSIGLPGKGLPLGNLTSQLFCNIYMNEFDRFVKHKLKAKYYVRYADDFVFLSSDRTCLVRTISQVDQFLRDQLKLSLHQDKLFVQTFASGVDFLGLVHWPTHRVLRTVTKRRMILKLHRRADDFKHGIISTSTLNQSVQSYFGLLQHSNSHNLSRVIKDIFIHIAE